MAKVCWLEVCKKKCKKVYILRQMKAHHDYQKFAQENKRPEIELPEDMTTNGGATYCLRNGGSSRELSQNNVTSEIL